MNYQAFFTDIANWIEQINQQAVNLGMHSDGFWQWVVTSAGELGNKYGNTDLVKKQICMLLEWLDDVYKQMQKGG